MIEPPAPVRTAASSDAEAIFEFAKRRHADDALLPLNPAKMRRLIYALTTHPPDSEVGVIGVIDGDGEIAASCALLLESAWYSDVVVVGERWINVAPPYRHLGYGKALISYAQWFADQVNLPLEIGILTLDRLEVKDRFYRSQGLRRIGSFYAYGVERLPSVKSPLLG